MIMSWHRVTHTPSTAYTEYSIHREQHTPSTAYTELLLATVLGRHFGSGSGSEPNRRHIRGPGHQYTRTVDTGPVYSTSPYPSEMGRFSVGWTAGQSVNTYNIPAIAICIKYSIKID
jgi:hypothetical protein